MSGASNAGIVKYDMKAAELSHRKINQPLDVLPAGDIDLPEQRAATQLRCQLSTTCRIDIGDDDLGSFACEQLNCRSAQTAGAACDDGDFSRYLLAHASTGRRRRDSQRCGRRLNLACQPPQQSL